MSDPREKTDPSTGWMTNSGEAPVSTSFISTTGSVGKKRLRSMVIADAAGAADCGVEVDIWSNLANVSARIPSADNEMSYSLCNVCLISTLISESMPICARGRSGSTELTSLMPARKQLTQALYETISINIIITHCPVRRSSEISRRCSKTHADWHTVVNSERGSHFFHCNPIRTTPKINVLCIAIHCR